MRLAEITMWRKLMAESTALSGAVLLILLLVYWHVAQPIVECAP